MTSETAASLTSNQSGNQGPHDEKNQLDVVNGIVNDLERNEDGGNTQRLAGLGFIATGVSVAGVLATGAVSKFRFDQTMPYIPELQNLVNATDTHLAKVGYVALPAAVIAIGAVKLGASTKHGIKSKPKLATMDDWSSFELNGDKRKSSNIAGRVGQTLLRRLVAGRVPIMASIGVGLAAFSTAIGTEVSEGPQRPIEVALTNLTPGDTLITGFDGAMPMVNSRLTQDLTGRIAEVAQSQNVESHILDLDLGTLTTNGQSLSYLALATNMPKESPLTFDYNDCMKKPIPVGVDSTSGMKIGDSIKVSGFDANVTEIVDGVSAINRVGVVMDESSMKCEQKSEFGPVHAVVLDTSEEIANAILAKANTGSEAATVITKAHYLQNSESFWTSNVKPITSVLSLVSGVFSVVAMGSSMRENMMRSRRNWAQKSGRKLSNNMVRGTEALRALKNGVTATIVGNTGALILTPFVVNTLESGFKAGVGIKELAVGSAIGIGGSVIGAINSIIKPQKIIDTPRNTN